MLAPFPGNCHVEAVEEHDNGKKDVDGRDETSSKLHGVGSWISVVLKLLVDKLWHSSTDLVIWLRFEVNVIGSRFVTLLILGFFNLTVLMKSSRLNAARIGVSGLNCDLCCED